MSHAVVLQVKLQETSPEEGMKMLNELVIPTAKALSGFQKGTWMRSVDNTGVGIVVFDTAEDATAAQASLNPPPGGPTLISSTMYEIAAEA